MDRIVVNELWFKLRPRRSSDKMESAIPYVDWRRGGHLKRRRFGTMSAPHRDQAIAQLAEAKAALDAQLQFLSDAAMVVPATIGGGDWSAKDLLGHVAFWEELAVEAIGDWKHNRPLRFWGLFAGGAGGVDSANAQNQTVTSAQSLGHVRDRASRSNAAVVDAIRSLSPADWQATITSPNGQTETLGELVGGILGAPTRPFGHGFAHLTDLEDYVKRVRATGP
jgi:hypothetical protein